MRSLFPVLVIIIGFTVIYLNLVSIDGQLNQASSSKHQFTFSELIENDLISMAKAKELPPEWSLIREQKGTGTSALSEQWLKESPIKVTTHSDGDYRLEYIFIAEDPANAKSRLLVQYGIYNIKTENKVWEKIRIYGQ